MKKDTIYVDADDEISAVADNVANSKAKVVALVLPKRCTMLHSSVNMKILNKAAKNAGKQIVLITNEKALLPIAATSGLYVAKTLSSKPEVPAIAAAISPTEEVKAELDEPEPQIDPNKPIGELAGEEAIEIDESKDEKPATKDSEKAKNKKLKVPNFDSFRAKLFLGIGGFILLIVLWYLAMFVLPRAEITVVSTSQEIPVQVEITASSGFQQDNIEEKSFVLVTESIDKAVSDSADTTGTKNVGQKASGLLTITNCESNNSVLVPAGTVVTASGPSGYTFTTDEDVSVPGSNFSGGGTVCDRSGTADVDITASNSGGNYNISSRSYSIDPSLGFLEGFGGAMSGGTDEEVKIVDQVDCDALKSGLQAESESDEIKQQLISEFEQDGVSASIDTYSSETVSSTCEPAVGQEADRVTAKATFKYTLSGVNSNSLSELIAQEAQNTAGEDQTIIDTGLSNATITVDSRSGGELQMTVSTTAITGVKQDEARIKELIKGKNARQTSDSIKEISGVEDVKIEYSPFWVNNTPNNVDKITIIFETQNEEQ